MVFIDFRMYAIYDLVSSKTINLLWSCHFLWISMREVETSRVVSHIPKFGDAVYLTLLNFSLTVQGILNGSEYENSVRIETAHRRWV